jgi:ribosomal-protein-alanine N-acetyltransferase
MEWKRDTFLISTDPDRLDLGVVHAFLTDSYWAKGITFDAVRRSIDASMPFGLYDGPRQIGFARVVTDGVSFAYLADVFVLPDYRGQGLARWLVATIMDHPDLRGVRGWGLKTRDTHPLYRQLGFTFLPEPSVYMSRRGTAAEPIAEPPAHDVTVEGRTLRIAPLVSAEDAERCAAIMAGSDPWITLGRDLEQCRRLFRDASREIYVVHDEADVVGFLVLNMLGAFVGYIQSVGVHEGWRGRGLGTRLIAFAEERIFRESPNVFVCVSDFNAAARALYERLGYEYVGELRDYIVPGRAELLLRKAREPHATASSE